MKTIAFAWIAGLAIGCLAGASELPPVSSNRCIIAQTEMRRIYDEVKTPYKYGVVLAPEKGKMLDNPNVFRAGGRWYMLYIVFDNSGYETHLAVSDDLLDWKPLGTVLPYGKPGAWDAAQADGGPSLFKMDWYAPAWQGANTLGKFEGRHWMTYIGGAKTGYETDPLAIGVATTDDPCDWTKPWQRADKPVLAPWDKDARPFEKVTLFKSFVVDDPSKKLGRRFVMYYNAKPEGEWVERIGMAVSDDMRNWTRYGADDCLRQDGDFDHGITGDPMVRQLKDKYVMFYFGYNWDRKGGHAFDTFAVSEDLVHWTKWKGPHLVEASEPWDRQHAHKPWVIRHDGVVYHFYCAVGDRGRVLALATSKPMKRPAPVWYEAEDFRRGGARDAFNLRRFGGSLNPANGWWAADFGKRDEVRLSHNMQVAGRPRRVRIAFDADPGMSGAECAIELAIGLVWFRKTLGTVPPAKTGEKRIPCTFESDLPPGGDWTWLRNKDREIPNGKPVNVLGLMMRRGKAAARASDFRMKGLWFQTVADKPFSLMARPDVYSGERPANVRAAIRNLGAVAGGGTFRLTVRDWQGAVLAESETKVADIGSGEERMLDVALPALPADRNYFGFEGTFVGPDGTVLLERPWVGSWVRELPAREDKVARPDLPWGMGVYACRAQWRGGSDERKRARAEAWMTRAEAIGVKWVRGGLDWAFRWKADGTWDFSENDRLVDLASRHGMSIVGNIGCGWPAWTKPYTEEGVDAYAQAIRMAVRHYKDRIRHWEIWNEPNLYCFWQGSEELYKTLLRKATAAVHEEDPKAVVVSGDTSGVACDYHRRCLAAVPDVDDFSFHPYRHVFDEDRFLADIRSVTALKPGAKAWMTEMGWYSTEGFSDERSQAVNLARAYLTAAAEPSTAGLFWYDFVCDGPDPVASEQNFGIVRYSGEEPKPACRAYWTVCTHLTERPFAFTRRELPGGAKLFTLASGKARAVWTDSKSPVRVPVSGVALNLMGERVAADEKGEVSLDVDHPLVMSP